MSAVNTAFRPKQEILALETAVEHSNLPSTGREVGQSSRVHRHLYFPSRSYYSTRDPGIPHPSAPNTCPGLIVAPWPDLSFWGQTSPLVQLYLDPRISRRLTECRDHPQSLGRCAGESTHVHVRPVTVKERPGWEKWGGGPGAGPSSLPASDMELWLVPKFWI